MIWYAQGQRVSRMDRNLFHGVHPEHITVEALDGPVTYVRAVPAWTIRTHRLLTVAWAARWYCRVR